MSTAVAPSTAAGHRAGRWWRRSAGSRTAPTVVRPATGEVVLSAHGVDVALGGRSVLRGAHVDVRAGEVVALVGPNGAGKSTLLGALAGDLVPARGEVSLCGRALAAWSPADLARHRAVLLQQVAVAFPFSVRDVVAMGRAPWLGTPAEGDDDRAIAAAMASADVSHLAGRTFTTLSGGERARAALARVLAQAAPVLLLDEPTAALDLHHQELVLQVARQRAAAGDAVVVVLHDLGLAAAHADRVVVLADGTVVADGPPSQVMTAERLSAVYHHDVEVLTHPRTGELLVLPRRDRGGSVG